MARIRLDTLADYHKHGFDLAVTCRACGHEVVLVPDYFFARGALGGVEQLERRLRCGRCRARAARISSTMLGPSGGRRRAKNWQDWLKGGGDP